ncbi:hypothetical protein AADG42_17045 [Ammonicoccus fulvus]|uniref:Uncharacterized protein n=1 Tax=Ammonicoccus fulvus TaxID=3138240 RepID=A0ABZ3FT88_9ACTN
MTNWDDTPLRERDLPNSELMLARILRDAEHDHVVVEELDGLDATPPRRRWLYAVAAAVMAVAIGSIGWIAMRPDSRSSEPAQQTTVPPATSTPSPTPTPEPTVEAQPQETEEPAPRRTPTATPTRRTTPTPSARPTATPSATPSTTATPLPTEAPGINTLVVRRETSPHAGMDYVHVRYELCSGSGTATVVGPVAEEPGQSITTLTPPADIGPRLGSGGSIGAYECIPRGVTLLVDDRATTGTIGVLMTFAAGTPEIRYNGTHSVSFTIP